MRELKLMGILICLSIVSCKEIKKEQNLDLNTETNVSFTKPEFLNEYEEVFIKKNLADKVKLSLYKHSTKDDFANSISHSFIFEVNDDESWDDLYGYKIVLQFIPIEDEIVLLNDNSKKRKIKSEYFNYDVLEYLKKNSRNMIHGENGKVYFKTNVHSRLNNLEQLNVLLQDKETYKYFGQKVSIKEYKLQ